MDDPGESLRRSGGARDPRPGPADPADVRRRRDAALYVEYLGCTLDWQEGEGDRPIDLEVSRDDLVLHLSSYPDDGTPGTAVLIATVGLDALLSELRSRNYPFMNPGIEDHPLGRELTLIDPASNRLRFFERR